MWLFVPDSKICIAPGRAGGGRGGGEGRVGEGREKRGEWRERGKHADDTNRREKTCMQTCYMLAMTLFYPTLYYMKYDLSYHGVDQAWLPQKNRSTMPSTFSCSSTELSTQNVPACPTCAIWESSSVEG